jgi:hypothetical protein
MQIIYHRRNTLEMLLSTDTRFGVEVDIRSHGDQLIIHHDPCCPGEDFKQWLDAYQHKTLILNVKEEGLEDKLIRMMELKGISDFFFLDQSFPFLVKWSKNGERRCAVRVSEFESVETALTLSGLIDWVWVDCFTKFPLNEYQARQLKDGGFKMCLVSPELQGRDAEIEIPILRSALKKYNINAAAVCTKRPDLWESKDF